MKVCPNCGGVLAAESIGWKCKNCRGFVSLQDGKFYEYVEKPFMPPMTNADRIRAMSDEELAEVIMNGRFGFGCDVCPECKAVKCSCECIERLTDWLRQPVKDGDNDAV